MKIDVELQKASMAFQLKNGEILLISKEDVNEIAEKVILEMILHKKNQIFMHRSTAVEKCNTLYKIVIEQKEKMSDEIRDQYLKCMLELIKTDEKEFITFEQDMEEYKKNNP